MSTKVASVSKVVFVALLQMRSAVASCTLQVLSVSTLQNKPYRKHRHNVSLHREQKCNTNFYFYRSFHSISRVLIGSELIPFSRQ